MNPTYVNRKKLIEEFNLNKPQKDALKIDKKIDIDLENVNTSINRSISKETTKEDLSLAIKILLPTLNNTQKFYKTDSVPKYVYKLNQVVNFDLDNEKKKKIIHLCIFNIIENPNASPIILYLLNKDETTNIVYFPHFNTAENVMDEANKRINELFEKWSVKSIFKGHIETGHNLYIFFEQKFQYTLEKLEYKNLWWWGSIFEIINSRAILNFPIDRTVYSIFYKNPLLISLFDVNDNKIVTPHIGYIGSYYTYIAFVAAFGVPKQAPTNSLGPYYYFSDYQSAGKWAIWSPNRKQKIINDEVITVNDFGVFKKGGIARFAFFGDNMKFFLNRENDPEDDSKISQELAKENQFYKKVLKVRDTGGKWADNHDIAYIGSFLKSDKYGERRYNIQFAIRDFYQQIPLTYHDVNTTEFRNISAIDKQQNAPYNYKDYNIA